MTQDLHNTNSQAAEQMSSESFSLFLMIVANCSLCMLFEFANHEFAFFQGTELLPTSVTVLVIHEYVCTQNRGGGLGQL